MSIETIKPKIELNAAEQEKKKIEFPVIEQLKEPIEKILLQLKENLDRGDYQLIIGDDASGRIPTRIFDTVVKHIYKEHGYINPETKFFAGSRHLESQDLIKRKEALNAFIRSMLNKHEPGMIKKALIVTDTISSGGSLKPLADALKQNGLEFDFAAIGFISYELSPERSARKKGKDLGGRIFYGQTEAPSIYGSEVSGVIKTPGNLFSEPMKWGASDADEERAQKTIGLSRADAAAVSQEIIAWYDRLPEKRETNENPD